MCGHKPYPSYAHSYNSTEPKSPQIRALNRGFRINFCSILSFCHFALPLLVFIRIIIRQAFHQLVSSCSSYFSFHLQAGIDIATSTYNTLPDQCHSRETVAIINPKNRKIRARLEDVLQCDCNTKRAGIN